MSVGYEAQQPAVPSGLPCWLELGCQDEDTARAFYGGLFGWRFETRRDPATPTGQYSIATHDGVAVAGQYRVAAGHTPSWILHLAVSSTAQTAEWVHHLGGQVRLGPVNIPGRGSILHAEDPSGAPVVCWQPAADWVFGTGVPNTFAGADLNTHDGAGADHFFTRLFGYQDEQIGDSEIDYAEWRLDRDPVLYRYRMGPEYGPDTPPHWMVYFEVDPGTGADAMAGRARELGGTVVIEPYATPFGRIAILADPEGTVFAVIDHSRTQPNWGRAEVDDPYDD